MTFETFILPPFLTELEQWILTDLIENIYCNFRRDLAENVSKIVTQMIYQNFKSSREVNFNRKHKVIELGIQILKHT